MPRLLTVSKDTAVLNSRSLLLNRFGYAVISTMDETEALSLAEAADGIVIGDTLPMPERKVLVLTLARKYPDKPIVALLRVYEDGEIPEATRTIRNTPDQLLSALHEFFSEQRSEQELTG